MSAQHVRQTEVNLGLPPHSLQAVIFYANRSWSHAWVYGPAAVQTAIDKRPRADGAASPVIVRKQLADLPVALPNQLYSGCYPQDGTAWGLKTGKVLLVSGNSPE